MKKLSYKVVKSVQKILLKLLKITLNLYDHTLYIQLIK